MSLRVVKLPDVGEGVAEAEIVEWHVKIGDEVTEDQILAAVMTDKATVEIPAPFTGRIVERGPDVGTVMAVGAKLVAIETSAAAVEMQEVAAASAEPHAIAEARADAASAVALPREAGRDAASGSQASFVTSPLTPPDRETPVRKAGVDAKAATARPLASPSVRRRAIDLGVDLRLVPGKGPAGRIRHEDLDGFVSGHGSRQSVPVKPRVTEEVKVVGLRRRIAERMAEATRRIAHFSYIEEVDVTALEELRRHLNERHAATRGKLTILPFVLRAIVIAVEDFPQMNALYDDEREIVTRHGSVHAGIATQTPSGLMVPVIANAEALGLWECAGEIRRLAAAVRDGSAKREELSGSTISITSLGDLGGIATTPVINRPEVAIVGINKIAVRPVWQNDRFAPRSIMNLSSSFDHRVIDGHDAARFIRRIKELIELPTMLFLKD
ncbi:dihydrolipoamide acetyltransferase family protein [Mesorhizobium sp. ANAO-SY3R2]|uniref:dihydrolipoamide acetyltransferase family protein n=1 Tax=Mesorhizobium sp. ANAO-SY3R2 TaxID=3166644 RepID=UPI00366EA318